MNDIIQSYSKLNHDTVNKTTILYQDNDLNDVIQS